MIIKLNTITPSLNKAGKEHWAAYGKRRDTQIRSIAVYILMNYTKAQIARAKEPALKRVKIHSQRQKELDYDNLVGGCKSLMDALKFNGLIVDDKPQWIEGGKAEYTQSIGKPHLTTITVEDPRDD